MKYKALKSAAHNFAHSFASDMNWAEDDYAMSHIARAAVVSGREELRADLRTGDYGPAELLGSGVRRVLEARRAWLDDLLRSHGADPARVPGARLSLRFDTASGAPYHADTPAWQIVYVCAAELTDDRGVVHRGEVHGVWIVDDYLTDMLRARRASSGPDPVAPEQPG